MLKKAIIKYQNRIIETSAVIQELIELARDMREARNAAKSSASQRTKKLAATLLG